MGRYGERDYRSIQQKREAHREQMETVKSYRLIENSIKLNARAMVELREIAQDNRKLTYSDLVIFLVELYKTVQKDQQWQHDHPTTCLRS